MSERPKAFITTDYGGAYYTLSVHDHVAVPTGVLDPSGTPIYRAPNPVGFVTDFPQRKPVYRVKAGRTKA